MEKSLNTYVGGAVSSWTCLTGLLDGGLSSDSFTYRYINKN